MNYHSNRSPVFHFAPKVPFLLYAPCSLWTRVLRLDITHQVHYNITNCFSKVVWEYVDGVNHFVQQHSAVLWLISLAPECECCYNKTHEYGKIMFLRCIYDVVVYKLDFDVSCRIGQCWKSRRLFHAPALMTSSGCLHASQNHPCRLESVWISLQKPCRKEEAVTWWGNC